MEKANECQEHRNEQQTTYTETDTHKSELIGNSLPLLLPSSNAFARDECAADKNLWHFAIFPPSISLI